MFINNHNNYNKKDIVIIQKKIYYNENLNIKSFNKIDIKQNDKSYDNIKHVVLEKSKKQLSFFFLITINMESISNGVEDYLIDGLSFKLPLGSSYITDRRKSTFWASGSNIYKAEGGHRFRACGKASARNFAFQPEQGRGGARRK